LGNRGAGLTAFPPIWGNCRVGFSPPLHEGGLKPTLQRYMLHPPMWNRPTGCQECALFLDRNVLKIRIGLGSPNGYSSAHRPLMRIADQGCLSRHMFKNPSENRIGLSTTRVTSGFLDRF
jgi:hypothetical protein